MWRGFRRGCADSVLPTDKPTRSREETPPNGSGGVSGVSDCPAKADRIYLSEVLIEVNCVFRFVPRPLTTAMMASAIPAAIRPYSIAVAPRSSPRKLCKVRFNTVSHFKPPFSAS